METNNTTERDQDLWYIAKKRVKFKRHLAAYFVINAMLWTIWYMAEKPEEKNTLFPWPLWSMLGWGVGLVFSYLNAYVFTRSNAIEREYQRLKDKSY